MPKSPVSILEALEAIGKADANVITSFADGTNVTETRLKAAAADVVLVVLAQSSTEGHDRDSLELPGSSLVPIVASVNRNVIVAIITPGPFLTDEWAQAAKAIIDMGLPGEQEGNGLVDVLFGAVNPSGRLPHTLPNKWNEVGMQPRQYPGVPPHNISGNRRASRARLSPQLPPRLYLAPRPRRYDQKLEVGYRWYNTHGVAPAFPFGHGLSYTTFAYSNLRIVSAKNGRTPRSVSVVVQNTGLRSGAEVVQLYVRFPASAGEPDSPQLRGFEKLTLAPGDKRTVTFSEGSIGDDRWLSIWDVKTHAWALPRGEFDVLVGASSVDIRVRGKINIL